MCLSLFEAVNTWLGFTYPTVLKPNPPGKQRADDW